MGRKQQQRAHRTIVNIIEPFVRGFKSGEAFQGRRPGATGRLGIGEFMFQFVGQRRPDFNLGLLVSGQWEKGRAGGHAYLAGDGLLKAAFTHSMKNIAMIVIRKLDVLRRRGAKDVRSSINRQTSLRPVVGEFFDELNSLGVVGPDRQAQPRGPVGKTFDPDPCLGPTVF